MPLVPMKAKTRFHYNRRDLVKGQEFEAASENDARILEGIGKARRREAQQYLTRVLTAETVRPVLDTMPIEALRAMAARMGVKVHHRAGVEKLRRALRQAGA